MGDHGSPTLCYDVLICTLCKPPWPKSIKKLGGQGSRKARLFFCQSDFLWLNLLTPIVEAEMLLDPTRNLLDLYVSSWQNKHNNTRLDAGIVCVCVGII